MLSVPKAVVITGGTKGIGRAIAVKLAQEGYRLLLNYAHDGSAAQETLQQCRQSTEQVHLFRADIAHKQEVEELMRAACHHFGTLDVLVNNAAEVRDAPFLYLTEEDWDHVVETNMKGAFLCAQSAARIMMKQESGGLILNIGAPTGILGRKNGANTCASKAGMMVLTNCIALELGPKVRANTIIPGLTYTEETAQRYQLNDPAIRQQKASLIPLQRIGEPEDIANAVSLLLTDKASFINGQKIVVRDPRLKNGGLCLDSTATQSTDEGALLWLLY
ncbi:3-oxoacyl-[acyl-carrier protein] reductase, partial [Thermosporothrix hazakensis]